jgi:hypothetical protein
MANLGLATMQRLRCFSTRQPCFDYVDGDAVAVDMLRAVASGDAEKFLDIYDAAYEENKAKRIADSTRYGQLW